MTTRLMACEARKMLRSTSFLVLLAATAVFTALTVASPAAFPGGPMFMTAGPEPDVVGGAIGFIGNLVDPENVAGSAARTAFVYTPFWLAVVIAFAASSFAADFTTRSVAVSKAKGTPLAKILLAKTVSIVGVVGTCYAASCLAAFLFKAHQYDAPLEAADFGLFFGILGTNVALLGALATQAMLLFSLLRSTFASALALLVCQVCVLLGYPSAYGVSGAGEAGNPLFLLSPVYYLMNTCSLSFDNAPLLLGAAYAAVAVAVALTASAAALSMREV